MRTKRLLAIVALLLVPQAAWPQGAPVGPEFRVNRYTTQDQQTPEVAMDATGKFVVVWRSHTQDGSMGGVFGQRFAGDGAPLGPEFRVNTSTLHSQESASVGADPEGNFVVVWASLIDVDSQGIFGQRFASSGPPLGSEFMISTVPTGHAPHVAVGGTGSFVVVWTDGAFGSSDVLGRRFDASGRPVGPEFRVNNAASGAQYQGSVAMDASGGFVVVWASSNGSGGDVFGQRFDSSGIPLGPEFGVNTYTTNFQITPNVASNPAGDFVVTWRGDAASVFERDIFGRRYASTGVPLGGEFRVNDYTTEYQRLPRAALDAEGNFVVVWVSQGQDGAASGIFGRRFTSDGAPFGPEFRVNAHTPDWQTLPAVSSDPAGGFVVVWESAELLSENDIFGQRFGRIVPVELTGLDVQ